MLKLFTDGSVNSVSRVGYGAYLTYSGTHEEPELLVKRIKLKRFLETSSTRLELQTLLWALSELSVSEIDLYTDSQNIVSLDSRKEKLEQSEYRSRSGKLLKNHDLYRDYFEATDGLSIKLNHVGGHMPSRKKSKIDKVFSLVDKAARKALRSYLSADKFQQGLRVKLVNSAPPL